MTAADDVAQDVAQYAAQVRAELGDLPPSLLDDLLEDLDEHLAEVAAEGGEPLLVLGRPADYAAELRAAAGLPRRPTPSGSVRWDHLQARSQRVRRHPAVQDVLAFLPELRPAWWVLRALLAVLALDYVFLGSPTGLGGLVLALPLLAAAVVVSVRAGQRSRRQPARDRRQQLLSLGANGLLGIVALVALAAVLDRGSEVGYAEAPSYGPYGGYASGPGLTHPDGSPITNVFPYSADGRPLTGVLLYDQDGRAVDELSTTTREGWPVERVAQPDGAPVPANSYPQQQRVLRTDEFGTPVEEVLPAPEPTSPSPAPPVPTTAPPSASTSVPPSGTDTAPPAATPGAGAVAPVPTPPPPAAAPPTVGP